MQVFGLVDCNNFYVSCERIFNPALKYKPVAVLSNNDGCIIARSNEAKALGLAMGAPYFKVDKFCKQHAVTIYSSNYALYGDISRRIMNILHQHVEQVEEYSIDEAFIRFDTINNPNDFYMIGNTLLETILTWVNVPVSIGFAPTKVLAKIANHVAKKQTQGNVFVLLSPSERQRILSCLPVGEIWGIGTRWQDKLHKLGIITAWELQALPTKYIRRHFSVVMERIILELQGTSCLPLEDTLEPRKEIVCSRSFGKTISTLSPLKEAISCYANRACEKLRQQQSLATQVKVFVQTHQFQQTQPYFNARLYKLTQPTQDTRVITKAAIKALEQLYLPKLPYKKVGVMLLGITDEQFTQPDLFLKTQAESSSKSKKLMQTIDCINTKIGKNSVFLASQGIKHDWQMKHDHRSSSYTTNWRELLKVK